MELVIFFTVFFAFAFTVYKAKLFKLTEVPVILLILLVSLKFGAGQVINKYYFDRYENQQHSDIYKYFEDGHELYKIALENPKVYFKIFSGLYESDPSTAKYVNRLSNWKTHTDNYLKTMNYKDSNPFNSNRAMARINSLFCFISQGYIPTQTLIFSFLSFLGIILVYLTFLSNLRLPNWLSFVALCCSPSLLIWTSSIQKESLMMLGIGLFSYAVFRKQKNYLLILPASLLLLYISYFNLLLLFLAWSLVLVYQKSFKWFFISICGGLASFFLMASISSFNPMDPIASRFNLQNKIGKGGFYLESVNNGNMVYFEHDDFKKISQTLNTKKENNLTYFELPKQTQVFDYKDGVSRVVKRNLENDQGWYYQKLHYTPAKSYVLHRMIEPDAISFISHFACAIENTMTIPYYKLSIITVPFFLESLILYALAALFFVLNFNNIKSYYSSDNVFLLLFAFFSILLIGYSTPIVGNIIRHKTIAMLFLIMLVMRIGFQSTSKK